MNMHSGAIQDVSFATKPAPLIAPRLTKRYRRLGIYAFMITADALSVFIGFVIVNAALLDRALASPGLKLCFLAVPIFLVLALNNHAYGRNALYNWAEGTTRSIASLFATLLLINFVLLGLSLLKEHHVPFLAFGFMVSSLLIIFGRSLCHRFAAQILGQSPISELILLDGITSHKCYGHNVVDARSEGLCPDVSDPAMFDRLGHLFRSVDRVIITCADECCAEWSLVLKSTGTDGEVHSNFIPPAAVTQMPLDPSRIYPLTKVQLLVKRSFDLVVVSFAILFLAPLMLLTALAIKLESSGPVLFKQQRLGYGSRLFNIYKFRSMRVEQCDASGEISASRDDGRITRVGRFIRATSIDELPQLFNVLTGSMSLVGPRPHALGSTANGRLFWQIDRNYWLRHATVPGLTGLAQIRGFRGATLEQSDLVSRLAADLEYIQRWSLSFDLMIMMRTFGVLVHRNAF
jgi:polysaccharide biosynthesis protein PslA